MRYLRQLLGRQPSQEPGAFGAFLHRQGAFVAQKTVLDYCRVKIGRNERDFFGNADFMAALNHCRWQVFLTAQSDVMALAEAWLRPFWPGQQLAAPRDARTLPLLAEAPLFATLPIHPDQRKDEGPAIRGALRFHILSTQQEMERGFDPAGLSLRWRNNA